MKKVVISLMCCIVVSLFLTASLSYAEIVGAWLFDEGAGTIAKDSSKFGNNGTIKEPNWVAGKNGKALQFDAAKNTVVEIPDKNNIYTLTNLTVACWVKVAKTNANWMGLVGKWELANTGVRNFGLWLHNPDCTPGFQAYGTHVAATYDGKKAVVYADGVNVGEFATVSKLSTTKDPVRIGRAPWAGHYVTGAIDEVAIYNNALTAAEIKTLMSGLNTVAVGSMGKLPITWAGIKDK
jgi:hypothetical protein